MRTNKHLHYIIGAVAIMFTLTGFYSCADDTVKDEVYIEFSDDLFEFDRYGGQQTVTVTSNRSGLEAELMSGNGWCDMSYDEGRLTVTAGINDTSSERSAIIKISGGGFLQTFSVIQKGRNTDFSGINPILKITPAGYSGTPSLSDNFYSLDNAFDGDYSTAYISTGGSAYVSVTFTDAERIDLLYIHSVADRPDGNLGRFTISAATEESPALTQCGSYDFEEQGGIRVVMFDPPLVRPTEVRLDCEPGYLNRVSFGELEFYMQHFDLTTIFADPLYSELLPGVTQAQIDNIPLPFYRELASDLFKGLYNTEFRVQEYKAWMHPDYMAKRNESKPYSLRDNPTGIYVLAGETLAFFAGDEPNGAELFIQHPNQMIQGTGFLITPGLNTVQAPHDGLIYIDYHTMVDPEVLPPLKINIVTGAVNGYFDINKHKAEDWTRILNSASFKHFDLVGDYAHLTFHTEMFRRYTPDGTELVKAYDEMVYMQQEFMGLVKYDRMHRNRMYFVVMEDSDYMHATSYYTGYDLSTQALILDLNRFRSSSIWGPAHEVGHMNQIDPNLKWHGMTEVTNNILSLYIQTQWGNRSRLLADNDYVLAREEIIGKQRIHNSDIDVFFKLVPFWQLKLYMEDVLDKKDFYKDVCQTLRNATKRTGPAAQMVFVRTVCDVAELDLTDFFEKWGFLRAGSSNFSEYSNNPTLFNVTESLVNSTKKYIADKGYELPPHDNIEMLTDQNIQEFRSTL